MAAFTFTIESISITQLDDVLNTVVYPTDNFVSSISPHFEDPFAYVDAIRARGEILLRGESITLCFEGQTLLQWWMEG